MDINWIAAVAASVAMFLVGAVWYMGLFAKQWGQMFGFDKLDKKTQQKMQKQMGPFYILQMIVTLLSAVILTKLIAMVPFYSAHTLAFILWLGMILPTQVSGVIFGGTEPKWIIRKLVIMAGESLLHLQVAALVIAKITA